MASNDYRISIRWRIAVNIIKKTFQIVCGGQRSKRDMGLYRCLGAVIVYFEQSAVCGTVGKENYCSCVLRAFTFDYRCFNIFYIFAKGRSKTAIRTAFCACPRHINQYGIGVFM